jgi:hypothetical protein
LPELFAAADELLNDRLDGLIVQFKKIDTAFYNEYSAARVIVVASGSRTAKVETPETTPNTPLAKAA